MSQTTQITRDQTEAIIQQLWREHVQWGEPIVYIILDGARNKKIHPLLDESGQPFSCLIEGRLDYGMTLAAPYMMRLKKEAEFTRTLIQQAWGNSWGIFAITYKPVTLLKVRYHCMDILSVQDEQTGNKLFFRYYDPRVLCNYIPLCNCNEASEFFGPINEFVFETNQNKDCNDVNLPFYRYTQTEQGVIDLNAISEHDEVKRIQTDPSKKVEGQLGITSQHMVEFEKHRRTFFFKKMQHHLQTMFTENFTRLGDNAQQFKWIERNGLKAMSFGFNDQQEICRYLNVAVVQGDDFYNRPWAQDILNAHYQPTTKAMQLESASIEQLEKAHSEMEAELNEEKQKSLQLFYDAHEFKVQCIGSALFNLNFKDDAELKAWLYHVGEQSMNYELFDDMEMDLWLDLSMKYGKDFHQQPWAQKRLTQSTLTPQEKLEQLLDKQPTEPDSTNNVSQLIPKDFLF